jgi:hypothetical protein
MKVTFKILKLMAVSWFTLAVTASGLNGMVLCFGADGHFALEMAHEGRCQGASDRHGHGRPDALELVASAGADCCGSCVDVSLSSDEMSQPMTEVRHSLTASDHLDKVLSAASVEAAIEVQTNPGPLLVSMGAALRASPALLAQRTIILRI